MSMSSGMKPAAAANTLTMAGTPALYLLYRLHEFKQRCKERTSAITPSSEKHITEKDFQLLNRKIEKLLRKLDKYDKAETFPTKEEECVVCLTRCAVIRTFPCRHRVVCRRCFVRTIQAALSQRLLPLRCVVCRAKIHHLEHTSASPSSLDFDPAS